MMMLRLLLLLTVSSPLAFGNYYIVTKDGIGTKTSSLSKTTDGNSYIYTDAITRKKITTPKSELSNIIPIFQKGKSYPEGTAESVNSSVKRALAAHPHLKKQLRSINDAWKASKVVDATMGPAIEKLVKEFSASDQSPDTYKKASYELGMLQFKDGSGTYTKTIKSELDKMLKLFIATNLKNVSAASEKTDITLDAFLDTEFLAKEMLRRKPPESDQIKALLETCRTNAIKANVPRSRSMFMSNKSIDSYLKARELVTGLIDIASSSTDKANLNKELERLVAAAQKSNKGYDLSIDGFPLTTKQKSMYTQYEGLINKVRYDSIQLESQCLLLPNAKPVHAFGKPARISYTLIFNRPQPAGRAYHLIRFVQSAEGSAQHTLDLGPLSVRNGQATFTFADTFSDLPAGFSPARSEEGQYGPMMIIPAYKKKDEETKMVALAPGSFILLE